MDPIQLISRAMHGFNTGTETVAGRHKPVLSRNAREVALPCIALVTYNNA